MNKKNNEMVKLDIWRNFENQGRLYYIEVFYYRDGTIRAFAHVRPGKVQPITEEFPIGVGCDDRDPTKAAIQAINNIQNQ